MNTKQKGSVKERASKALFEDEGWYVTKASASLGVADLVCLKAGERPLLVQVKCNSGSPWMNFRSPERTDLFETAKRAGAVAVLAYWKPRARTHQLIESIDWP